jgi:hypothetical protein
MAPIPQVLRLVVLLLLFLGTLSGFSLIPLIPVLKGAPVPPELARYSLTLASLEDLFGVFYPSPVGVLYRLHWYSVATIFAVLAASGWISASLTRRFFPTEP